MRCGHSEHFRVNLTSLSPSGVVLAVESRPFSARRWEITVSERVNSDVLGRRDFSGL